MAGGKPETAEEQPSAMSASPRQQPLWSGVSVGGLGLPVRPRLARLAGNAAQVG